MNQHVENAVAFARSAAVRCVRVAVHRLPSPLVHMFHQAHNLMEFETGLMEAGNQRGLFFQLPQFEYRDSVRTKDRTLRVPNKTTTLFLFEQY